MKAPIPGSLRFPAAGTASIHHAVSAAGFGR